MTRSPACAGGGLFLVILPAKGRFRHFPMTLFSPLLLPFLLRTSLHFNPLLSPLHVSLLLILAL
jgi:RsiW-degrading membrane proteinase PrsW (M82 family)